MKRQHGFTLIELLVVIVLIAIVLAVTVPGFRELMERRRVEGVANELSADLQFARSEAVSRQAAVVFATAADGASYTVTSATTKTVTLPAGITLTGSIARTYEALRGTGGGDVSIDVASTGTAGSLRINSNFMGRVQICSPSGTLKGYTVC